MSLLVVGALIVFKKMVAVRLFKVVDIFDKMDTGDLTERLKTNPDQQSGDELDIVAIRYNMFLDKISSMIMQIREAAQLLNTTAELVSETSKKISVGTQLQSTSFEELAASFIASASNIQLINEISRTTTQTTDNVRSGMGGYDSGHDINREKAQNK